MPWPDSGSIQKTEYGNSVLLKDRTSHAGEKERRISSRSERYNYDTAACKADGCLVVVQSMEQSAIDDWRVNHVSWKRQEKICENRYRNLPGKI